MTSFLKTAAVAALVASAPAANAATLTFAGGTGGLTPGQVNYADFDTTFGIYTTTGTTGITSGTTPGTAAEPAFSNPSGNYFFVSGGGTANFTFGYGASSFGFDLGSADTYNSLLVRFGNGSTQLITDVNNAFAANGDQSIPATNGRVTIVSQGGVGGITGVEFRSGQPSFEFDNIGLGGAVPEPATWAMLILGFGVVGGALRRARPTRMALRHI